jgi:hypothetical protein
MAQEIIFNDDVKQEIVLTLDTGDEIKLKIFYKAMFQGFYLISYTYLNIEKYINLRLTLTPFGILNHADTILPFDLICYSNDKIEPVYINDFQTGRVKLILINKEEKQEIINLLKQNAN